MVNGLDEGVPLMHPCANPEQPGGEYGNGGNDVSNRGIVLAQPSSYASSEDDGEERGCDDGVDNCSGDERSWQGHFF